MSDNIIQLNADLIHTELKNLVKNSVEETLNAMLDAEADKLVNAERYARDEQILSIVLRTFDFALPLSCRQLLNL